MDSGRLMTRARAILTNPKSEWPMIEAEQITTKELYLRYILLLAAITPVAGFLKMSVFGIGVPMMGTYRLGFGVGIGYMLVSYVLTLAGVYLMALAVNLLAPSFGGRKDDMQALKTVAYAHTAAWVAGVGQILPWVGMLILLAGSLYSIYLLYLGLPVTMKCPRERVMGYTAVTIVIAVIVSFAISAVVAGGIGGRGMMGSPSSSRHFPIEGSFDKDSPGGKLEEWTKKMESATKEVEEAQKSGDSAAQSEAMAKLMAAAMGSDGKIETLAPERIKAFLPANLAGRPRSAVSAERTGAMGFQISRAEASYGDGSDSPLQVEIIDMGLAKGVMALAGWIGVEQERVTDNGYEKTYKNGGKYVHERWNRQNSSGEYSTLLGERFSVKVSGGAAGIEVLREAANSIDLAGLAALKDEGVTK